MRVRKNLFPAVLFTVIAWMAAAVPAAAREAEEGIPSIAVGSDFQYAWNEEYERMLCSAWYPSVYLEDEDGFPELAAVLDKVNQRRKEAADTAYESLSQAALEDVLQIDPDLWKGYSYEEQVIVRRADQKVLSLLFQTDTYSGGPQSFRSYTGENYVSGTGQLLSLSDVVTDREKLSEAVQKELDTFWGDLNYSSETAVADYFSSVDESQISWVLDYYGITLFFHPFDLTSYPNGVQTVTLSFDKYPQVFREVFRADTESYCIPFECEQPFYYDADQDGMVDEILVSGILGEEGAYVGYRICVNGNEYTDEYYCYALEPVFVHLSNGKNLLYLQSTLDNDYRQIHVLDLSSGKAEQNECLPAGFHQYLEQGQYMRTEAITTPERFRLDSRSDVLGTAQADRWYQADENGIPVSRDPWYTVHSYSDLGVLSTLNVSIVDGETGEITGEGVLQPGDRVRLVHTDLDSFADLRMENGQICRVKVNTQWPQTVNGIDAEQIFEGMMFAG